MKPRKFALLATISFSAIAAFPTVVQAADENAPRAKQCRAANDTRIQYGLPTLDCAAFEKTASGVMGPVRTMDTKSSGHQASKELSPTPGSAGNLTQF